MGEREEISPRRWCVLCDLHIELHEDEQGFHHVGFMGQRLPCGEHPRKRPSPTSDKAGYGGEVKENVK